jgi:hypothetical protein
VRVAAAGRFRLAAARIVARPATKERSWSFVMRPIAVIALAIVLGCEVTPDEGVSISGPGAGDSVDPDDGTDDGIAASSSEGDDDASASAGSTGDASDTGNATFQPGETSWGADSSDGAADTMGGAAEDGGAYAPCTTSADCFADPGLACLTADQNGANGFCSPSCGTMGASPPDAQLCPPAPAGITATRVCVEGFVRNCALSCAGGLSCPGGTSCLAANNGGGPYCFGD